MTLEAFLQKFANNDNRKIALANDERLVVLEKNSKSKSANKTVKKETGGKK